MNGRLIAAGRLDSGLRRAMFDLLGDHFEGVTEACFESDLAEKNWVILIEDGNGALKGFSTLHVYEAADGAETVQVVYSGDTIMHRSAWGSPALARSWIGSILRLRAQSPPERRWLWLLITSGFRTYRFLSVFWRRFVPRHDAAGDCGLRDRLVLARFGAGFDPTTGIVRLAAPQRLREDLCVVPAGRERDPHTAFFLAANPGWADGDELACLCELADDNLTPAGRRVVASALKAV